MYTVDEVREAAYVDMLHSQMQAADVGTEFDNVTPCRCGVDTYNRDGSQGLRAWFDNREQANNFADRVTKRGGDVEIF